jgi:hypothetical protein
LSFVFCACMTDLKIFITIIFLVLEDQLRVLHLLDRHSTT